MKYAQRVSWVAGEATSAWDIHYQALRQRESDPQVIVLSVGDPDFATPDQITHKAIAALQGGDTHYAPVVGRQKLREAIALSYRQGGGHAITAANVAVLAGAQNALFTASLCVLDSGDEVISFDPMYLTYPAYLGVSGAKLVRVDTDADSGFRPDAELLAAAITPATRAIAFSNPNNPSGVVMSRSELEGIAQIARQHDLWVISDEVYASLSFEQPHTCIAALDGMAERTITVGSLSKSHAMTGWRAGWMIGPEPLIQHAENMALCMLYGLPGFVQEAALEALTGASQTSADMRNVYRRRRDLVVSALADVTQLNVLSPQSGMFVLVDVRQTGLSAIDFARELYAQEKVSVLDGAAFGSNVAGFVRLSFTNADDVLLEACERIARFVRKISN